MKKLVLLLVLCLGCREKHLVKDVEIKSLETKPKISRYVGEKYSSIYNNQWYYMVISKDGYFINPSFKDFTDIKVDYLYESTDWKKGE